MSSEHGRIVLEPIEMRLDTDRTLEITLTDRDGIDLSLSTAKVSIKDADGNVLLPSTSMTGSGMTERVFRYTLLTGAGQTITAAGAYKAYYEITFGAQHEYPEQDIFVLPVSGSRLARVEKLAGVAR